MELEDVVDELVSSNEFDLERVADHPVDRIGALCDEITDNFRTLAGCAVLLEADTDGFRQLLIKSGETRRYYLGRCAAEAPELRDPYRAASNGAAFFDALAAGDVGLAREIASLSSTQWWEGEEYPEDFHFLHFLHRLLEESRPAEELASDVDLLEGALEGAEPGKLDVCRALSNADQEAFDPAMEDMLTEYAEHLESLDDPYTPYEALARRVRSAICVEALALLNIAELRGLTTQAEYRFCPLTARVRPASNPPDHPQRRAPA